MGGDGIIGENVFVVPVRVLPLWPALFSGFFQLTFCLQLLVPVFIGIGRLLSDIGDIILFIQTEKIPQPLTELFVMLVHDIHLSLYVIRMAQSARTHRHGFFPLALVPSVTGLQGFRKQVYFTAVQIQVLTHGIEVRFPFGGLFDGGTHYAVLLRLKVLVELHPCQIRVETDMMPGRKSGGKHTPHLRYGRRTARGDENRLSQLLVLCLMELVIGHRVIGTFEPIYMFGFRERCLGRAGYP